MRRINARLLKCPAIILGRFTTQGWCTHGLQSADHLSLLSEPTRPWRRSLGTLTSLSQDSVSDRLARMIDKTFTSSSWLVGSSTVLLSRQIVRQILLIRSASGLLHRSQFGIRFSSSKFKRSAEPTARAQPWIGSTQIHLYPSTSPVNYNSTLFTIQPFYLSMSAFQAPLQQELNRAF